VDLVLNRLLIRTMEIAAPEDQRTSGGEVRPWKPWGRPTMFARIMRHVRRRLRRPIPRPGSVRRVGDQPEVFYNGRWEPLPQHRAPAQVDDAPSGPPLLALRCPQSICADLGPIGKVWSERDDVRGLWAADSVEHTAPSLHRRAVDAARWVRTQHDARHHTATRWTPDHLDAASVADIAAARLLTGNPEDERDGPDTTGFGP